MYRYPMALVRYRSYDMGNVFIKRRIYESIESRYFSRKKEKKKRDKLNLNN